ncbi:MULTISPECIES: LamG-like jellyroll fold domain-containing protein [Streptosporangium]|uniref:Fibronectin type-III domain-containing protein n=1 Tax=Streptosporangium brasiliense TaxID=47480 RepID=A0ABT9RG33_9ACTN|nr:LamG-like jellyroll fold domain-containing protein [Streptosporangium brasiliense]MDP9868248.1 hypothetical protein [Streptosporangium brasiliense]
MLSSLFTLSALLITPGAASASVPEPGLVAAFGMNEGSGSAIGDASGNGNNGTATATTWVDGKFGKALSFDGLSGLVTVNSSASLRLSSAMTLEAWVNPATADGRRPVIAKGLGEEPEYALTESDGLRSQDEGIPTAYVNTLSLRKLRASRSLPVYGWHHLAATYDGQWLRIYIDGFLSRRTAVTGTIQSNDGALLIGGHPVWGEYFKGSIDEVRIYNVARTTAQIQLDMANPITATDSPPSAPTDLTVSTTYADVGLRWKASSDDYGVRGYEVHRSTISGFTPSSSTWIGATTSAGSTLYSDVGQPSGVYYYRVVALDTATQASAPSNQATATITTPGDPPSAPGPLTAGGRLDGAELSFVKAEGVHGVSHYQLHRSTTPGFTPNDQTRIANITTTLYSDYYLEDGVYYYRVIAVDYAGQVGPPSNEASARIPDLPPTAPEATVQAGAGRAEISWTAASDDDAVTAYEVWRSTFWNFSAGSTASVLVGKVTTRSVVDTGLSAGRYYYRVRALDTAHQPGELSASAAADVTECPPADCLVAAYGMEDGGVTVTDASGNGNNGTATATTSADGKHGRALAFISTTSEVMVPYSPSLHLDTAMTVEAWVYPTEITGSHVLASKGSGQRWGQHAFTLYSTFANWNEPPSGPYIVIDSYGVSHTSVLPVNTWTHLAATFGGGKIRLYVNGVLVPKDYEPTYDPIKPETNPIYLGRSHLGDRSFKGLIDDVRIYTTPLTAEQIQADMNTPVGGGT